jgi:hypothetical protein
VEPGEAADETVEPSFVEVCTREREREMPKKIFKILQPMATDGFSVSTIVVSFFILSQKKKE